MYRTETNERLLRNVQRQPCRLRKDEFCQSAGDTPATTFVTSAGPVGCAGFNLDGRNCAVSRLLSLAEFLESGIGA
jgi:hypothetical protein